MSEASGPNMMVDTQQTHGTLSNNASATEDTNLALWVAFMNFPMKQFLGIPEIYRDREHQWILAKTSTPFLIYYAKKQGFNDIVQSNVRKLNTAQHLILFKSYITGNKIHDMMIQLQFFQVPPGHLFFHNEATYSLIELIASTGNLPMFQFYEQYVANKTFQEPTTDEKEMAYLQAIGEGKSLDLVKHMQSYFTKEQFASMDWALDAALETNNTKMIEQVADVTMIKSRQNQLQKMIQKCTDESILPKVFLYMFSLLDENILKINTQSKFIYDIFENLASHGRSETIEYALNELLQQKSSKLFKLLFHIKIIACVMGHLNVVRVIDKMSFLHFDMNYIKVPMNTFVEIVKHGYYKVVHHLMKHQELKQNDLHICIEEASLFPIHSKDYFEELYHSGKYRYVTGRSKETNHLQTVEELLTKRTAEIHMDLIGYSARYTHIWSSLQNAIYNAIDSKREDIGLRLLKEKHLGFTFKDYHPKLSPKAYNSHCMELYQELLKIEESK